MFSSATAMWATPQAFFYKLNEEFNFTLDVCATKENAKCDKFFTIDDNGLEMSWGGSVVGVILLMAEKLESGLRKQVKAIFA